MIFVPFDKGLFTRNFSKFLTILDINSWTYAKYWQTVLFLEYSKSAYFLSASSDRDKLIFCNTVY